jgi:hypothetical protein
MPFGLRTGSAITRRSGRSFTARIRARSIGTAFFPTRTIRATLFALGLVGAADLLAGTIRGVLLQCILERFHFTGEALYLAAEFFDAGVVGIAVPFRAAD